MIDLESPDGTICLELVKKLQDAGFRFAEVPVHHYHRTYGNSHSSSTSGACAAFRRSWLRLWWKLVVRREHLRTHPCSAARRSGCSAPKVRTP